MCTYRVRGCTAALLALHAEIDDPVDPFEEAGVEGAGNAVVVEPRLKAVFHRVLHVLVLATRAGRSGGDHLRHAAHAS